MTKTDDDLWMWRYRLRLRHEGGWNAKSPRREAEGFLLRAGGGFGCVHPWPQLGDAPVEEQLSMLRNGGTTPLLKRALDCARADGAARREGRSWWAGDLRIPPSHATVTAGEPDFAALKTEGFGAVKLKGGPDFAELLPRLAEAGKAGLRVRIDFNGTLTPEAFPEFTGRAAKWKDNVEFVEDPVPWDAEVWRRLRGETGWPLALDRLPSGQTAPDGGGAWDFRVIKPALEIPPASGELKSPAVFTSYMDHPVGQLFAAWEAACHSGEQREAGLLTHRLLEPDAFTEILGTVGPVLTPPPGTGLGFDDLLEALPWSKVKSVNRYTLPKPRRGGVLQNPRAPLPGPLPELPENHFGFGTSGSTGEPSIIVHSRESLEASAVAVNQWLGLTAEDVWLRVLPVFHAGGFQIHTRARLAGGRVVEDDERWDPRRFATTCAAEGVNVTSLVPTQVFDLTREGLKAPPCLKGIIVGGGALDAETWRSARALGWPVLPSYGLTEAASQVATARPDALSPGDEARDPPELHLLPCWEARLAAETEESADGAGILEIRGPALCLGRHTRRENRWHWEAAPEDGWWRTADRVRLAGRRLIFSGRADRAVKVLGELVNLDLIENQLIAAGLPPGRFAVAALPDERAGNRLVLVSEMDAAAALAVYQNQAPPFARLAAWTLTPELPRTALGKIRRGVLAERLAGTPGLTILG